ncbi:MAG TPA: hypothetical protein VMR98_02415 [Candidatus Polarisedimenticolaceae bacterium]|nr:hypothetical protein [Candidatus Polarisedimenticolaceae bacterium]
MRHDDSAKAPSTTHRADANLSSMILRVSDDQSLRQMITAMQHHKGVDSRITEINFPVKPGQTKAEAVLVPLSSSASKSQVRRELRRRGLRPATIPELRAFGAQYLKGQADDRIFYVRSVYVDPYGPYLGIEQAYAGKTWPPDCSTCRFLAVRINHTVRIPVPAS